MTSAPLLLFAASLVLSLTPPEMEQRAAQHLARDFERVGRSAPALDESLTGAARALARKALERSAKEAASTLAVTQAVSDANGYDPSPRALVIRGSPPDEALSSFLSRTDAKDEAASKMGVGASIQGDRAALVALLATRKVSLKPFPRAAKPRSAHQLCGELVEPFSSADVYVTRPDGQVDKIPLSLKDARFCAKLELPSTGRYSIELVGSGRQGPEVAAIFFVDAGTSQARGDHAAFSEPKSLAEARSVILARINAVRKVHGLRPVELDEVLNSVAQTYSERMSSQNFFAHVAPDGSDLRKRLHSAGYDYQVAAENLGLATGALAAHFSIEQSPGHLRNLIDGRHARLGIGVAYQKHNGQPEAVVTEILAQPVSATSNWRGRSP